MAVDVVETDLSEPPKLGFDVQLFRAILGLSPWSRPGQAGDSRWLGRPSEQGQGTLASQPVKHDDLKTGIPLCASTARTSPLSCSRMELRWRVKCPDTGFNTQPTVYRVKLATTERATPKSENQLIDSIIADLKNAGFSNRDSKYLILY